jgi:hypothetical protein
MTTPANTLEQSAVLSEWRRQLPHRLRLLFVGLEEPPWALLALRLETAGCAQAEFDWESEPGKALARLRKVTFDCIIARCEDVEQPAAVGFVEALRGSGSEDPIVVLAALPHDERTMQFDNLDCELLVTAGGWHSRALTVVIRRAVARGNLRREISGLEVSARRSRVRDRDDAEVQLAHLRDLLERLNSTANEASVALRTQRTDVVTRIEGLYHELLRTYVMMGSGSLAGELLRLTELMALAGLSPVEAMAIHVSQMESLLQGLGSRGSRHVMWRADQLALELLIRLGELYRTRSPLRGLGDTGIDLLHAESLLQRPHQGAA